MCFFLSACISIFSGYTGVTEHCVVMCSSIFGNDGTGIIVKRLNSDEESSSDSDVESIASSSGRSSTDAPLAKVPRTSDTQKPIDVLIGVCSVLKFSVNCSICDMN